MFNLTLQRHLQTWSQSEESKKSLIRIHLFCKVKHFTVLLSGELIINIVDVNRHAPVFGQPAYVEKILEEQPIGTILNTYTATDKETPIAAIVINPPSPYFQIDNVTGKLVWVNMLEIDQDLSKDDIECVVILAYTWGI